jgi:hypothetical protein
LSLELKDEGLKITEIKLPLQVALLDALGISIIAFFVLRYLMEPIAAHSFYIKAMKKLYRVRTRDPSFMDAP